MTIPFFIKRNWCKELGSWNVLPINACCFLEVREIWDLLSNFYDFETWDKFHPFFFDPSCITSAPVVTQITAAHSSSLSSGSLSSCLLRLHLRQSTCFLIGQHSFPFTRESSTIPQSWEFQLFRRMLWWYVEDIFWSRPHTWSTVDGSLCPVRGFVKPEKFNVIGLSQ